MPKLFFDLNSFSSRISGYPTSQLSGRIPGIKKGRISGTTLAATFNNHDGDRVRLVVVSLRDVGESVLARLGDGRILL